MKSIIKPDNWNERNIPGHFVQPHPWSSLFLPSQTTFLIRPTGHQPMSEYLCPPGRFYMNCQMTIFISFSCVLHCFLISTNVNMWAYFSIAQSHHTLHKPAQHLSLLHLAAEPRNLFISAQGKWPVPFVLLHSIPLCGCTTLLINQIRFDVPLVVHILL